MKLSKKFLSDYIDLTGIQFSDLAEKMVFVGNEYESIQKLCNATDLVVGKVIECVDHPESDHLHICQVDIGEEIKQIVCGAPNVRSDIKVIIAKLGAILPGNFVIKEATLAGTKSEGMICSLEELGIENKYLKEEDKTGIHILDNDAIVGESAVEYLELDDEIIDFELTSNRADLMNVIGMAYEVGAIIDKKVKLPSFELKESNININDNYYLDVRTENCPIYLGRLVKDVVIKESPTFIKNRLMASGIRPINNVVDISNYVMLEYGNPLHFFDANKLGNKIVVRMADQNENITTLDGIERKLNNTDIVIANDNGPVALAGVMGGLSTEVTDDTTNIFIEAAIFDSSHIRKTSRKILRSEASSRYERGIDQNRVIEAINRAAYLLDVYASGNVEKGILTHETTLKNEKRIVISLEKINSVLGMQLAAQDIKQIFTRLNFPYKEENNTFEVHVPTRRLDISIKEDLIEEIGRIYGYNNIKSILPTVPIKQGKRSYKNDLENKIKNRLSSLGLYQVVTYSLVSEEILDQFVSNLSGKINVLSPMSEDRKVMRQSIIPSLINVYDYNAARKNSNISIFEIGSIYYKEVDYTEETKVAGLLSGNYEGNTWQGNTLKIDFYVLKGIIENILEYLGYTNRYSFGMDTLKDLHPGISCSIKIDNEIIGYMGKIHPSISKKDIYVFEFSLEKLMSKKVRLMKFKELNKYPAIHKDLAFIVSKQVESENIMNILKKVGGRLLKEVDVFDIYTGDAIDENEKSIAYSLTFENSEKTLLDEEVTEIFNKMITEVETKLNAKLRNK